MAKAEIILPTDSVFHFKLPEDGLSLHSAGFSNEGAPELRFEASPKVPTLQEEDVATIFRLANENKRPNFFYIPFPFTHPLHDCRLFMEYSPTWLRDTKMGKLLADADWNMKCLHVGVRSNEDMTSFKSWSLSSNLEGLATHLDFPSDGLGGSVMMTCDHVTTSQDDNEIVFLEEPKMKITDHSNSLYSKYITEHYQAVGYYDQPVFLKMQELIKLIVAVEWFHEKGVKMNQEWMMDHTSKDKEDRKLKITKKPPLDMIPKPSSYERPSNDVTVKTFDACRNQAIARVEEQYYGYVDFGGAEIRAFKADGTMCPPLKCLKVFIEDELETQKTVSGWVYVPLPPSITMDNLLRDKRNEILKAWEERRNKGEQKSLSTNLKVDDLSTKDNEVKVRLSDTIKSSSLSSFKRTLTMTATIDNYAAFPEKYLKMPVCGSQGLIFPDVESWDELLHDLSVPSPAFWQHSIDGIGMPTATGGVSTSSFEHRKVSHPTTSYSEGSGFISSRVKAPKVTRQGAYCKKGEELSVSGSASFFTEISKKFKQSWIREGPLPEVIFVFKVNNSVLEREWNKYKKTIQNKEHKMFYHGTSVCERITSPEGQLCNDKQCGICGISNNGMNLEFAGRSFPEYQRFGKGIYLAPYSSKSDDYTTMNRRGYRAMLLCDVLLSRPHIINDGDSEDIRGPDPNFDSIVVKKGTHRVPEIVVFDESAVLPRYIIVYKKTEDK